MIAAQLCEYAKKHTKLPFSFFLSFFFFFGHGHSMWKFPGQGSNPYHISDPSHCSDDTRSLTCCATRELLKYILSKYKCYGIQIISQKFFFVFLGPHLQHMEVPSLGVKLEPHLRATPQPQQHWILNLLSEAGSNPHPHGY